MKTREMFSFSFSQTQCRRDAVSSGRSVVGTQHRWDTSPLGYIAAGIHRRWDTSPLGYIAAGIAGAGSGYQSRAPPPHPFSVGLYYVKM